MDRSASNPVTRGNAGVLPPLGSISRMHRGHPPTDLECDHPDVPEDEAVYSPGIFRTPSDAPAAVVEFLRHFPRDFKGQALCE